MGKNVQGIKHLAPFGVSSKHLSSQRHMPHSLNTCINTTTWSHDLDQGHTPTMERIMRLLALLVAIIAPLTAALKFDLHPVSAHDAAKYERCIRNFVAKDQLVVVTAILDGYRGDGQKVDMHVRPSTSIHANL